MVETEKKTTIQVNKKTWQMLVIEKGKQGITTFDELIKHLFKNKKNQIKEEKENVKKD